MPENDVVKRPPNSQDYVLRALYKLLDKQYGTRRKSPRYTPSYKPMSRGFGPRGSRGSGRTPYAPQHRFTYSAPKDAPLPKHADSYPRESRPYVQSLPQLRTETDVEELMRQLEQKYDRHIVDEIMSRMDAEANATEHAMKANPSEEDESDGASEPAERVTIAELKQMVEQGSADAEPKPSEEPEQLDDFELDDLEWLNEDVSGLVVEARDADAGPTNLGMPEAAETVAGAPEVPEPSGLVAPELEPLAFEPTIEPDPLDPMKPESALEEAEDGEAEP